MNFTLRCAAGFWTTDSNGIVSLVTKDEEGLPIAYMDSTGPIHTVFGLSSEIGNFSIADLDWEAYFDKPDECLVLATCVGPPLTRPQGVTFTPYHEVEEGAFGKNGKRLASSLSSMLETHSWGAQMLSPIFSFKALHQVYSQIWHDCHIDPANFRRKMTKSQTLVSTGGKVDGVMMYSQSLTKQRISPAFDRNAYPSKKGRPL